MKKIAVFLLLALPLVLKANTCITGASGNWSNTGTWVGGIVPATGDIVIITGSVSVTEDVTISISSLTINTGSTLTMASFGVTLTITGNFSNSGTFSPGSGSTVVFQGSSNQSIFGAGTTTFDYLTINPSLGITVSLGQNITINNTFTISNGIFDCEQYQVTGNSGGNISMSGGTTMLLGSISLPIAVSFPTGYTATGISLSSSSTVVYQANTSSQSISTTPSYGNLQIASNNPTTKTPSSSSSINIAGNLNISSTLTTFSVATNTINLTGNATIQGGLTFSSGSFNIAGNFTDNGTYLSTSGTTTFNGSSAQTMGGSVQATFYDLTIAPSGSTTITLGSNENITDNLTISSGTLDVSASGSYSLSVGNNFTNNSTFLCRNGTVNLDGTATQTLGGSGGLTFYDLTLNGGSSEDVLMSIPITVNDNLTISDGTFNCQTSLLTASGGTMNMSNGTMFILGLTTSGTVGTFPGFTTFSLTPGSTVVYQANTTQTVSTTPTYANLTLSTGSTASTKTASSSSLTVAGNLTINSNTTFSGVTGTLTLGGNLTTTGTYSVATGSTVLFDGTTSTQVISGASAVNFYNMTVSPVGISVQLGYGTTIQNNLTINSGTLDVTTSSFNIAIGSNFYENGGALNPHSNTVTMNGTSGPYTLGGAAITNLNVLDIGTGSTATSVNLGGTITATSNITIGTSASLNAGSYTVNIAGNFTDNGTFNCNTGTVYFDNGGKQCVSGTHTSETFENLTIGPMSILGTSCNIDIDGTILIQPGGLMACVCH